MTLFNSPPSAYRTRFFLRLISAIRWPFSLTFLLLRIFGSLPWHLQVVAYVTSFPLWIIITDRYRNWHNGKLAKQHGAEIIPCVQGRWPGNFDVMLRMARDTRKAYAQQTLVDLLDEHHCDTLNLRILWRDRIITRDDLVMRTVHSIRFLAFKRSADGEEMMAPFLGRGVFVTNGEEWKHNRAMLRPFFHRERISDLHIIDECAEQTLSILTSASQTNNVIDVQDLYSRFSLDSGADFLLGLKPKSLCARRPVPFQARLGAKGAATDDEFGTFAHAFDHIQIAISQRSSKGIFWPLHEMFRDHTFADAEIIKQWIIPRVNEALLEKAKRREATSLQNHEERTLLDTLTEETEDEASVRYGLLNVLMAARDTTAALLSFTTYFLSLHPEVMERLRQEVIEICGQAGRPTRESLTRMSYLNAVLNEALRLFPPASAGARQAVKDTIIRSGDHDRLIHIPNNAHVMYIPIALHRRKDLWGEDADDFNPERWLDPAMTTRLSARPTMYIPFLQGPRMCPGQEFAKLETSYLLARIVQKFSRFELVPEALPKGAAPPQHWKSKKGRQTVEQCWPRSSFTLYIKGGLWIRVYE
ncbi:cytochrome P450 monooxygenase CYP63 [Obba rivulosa]|uniref:Cytochrome P450 monooxygenase CYP63 n=1 Tax=Obba rivulosa TaxID=1052685 RepID=A0A8E2ATV0_9APHY|nr:cytochrome P450 monooxygenase CYP63 [Obba rivulosa]